MTRSHARFIECIGVGKTYAAKTGPVEALRGIDIACAEGEFVCLLGLSGCGKSTLLQMIAGLEPPTTGQIVVAGRELDGPSPATSIVFQDHGLFPWMTVQRNVEFNLKARDAPAADRRARAQEMLALTGLQAFATRYPHELSGGMRQRVGIARALTTKPARPADGRTVRRAGRPDPRANAIRTARHLWTRHRTTILFVTHSIDEAITLADRVLVFTPRPGQLSPRRCPLTLPRPRDARSEAPTPGRSQAGCAAALGPGSTESCQ